MAAPQQYAPMIANLEVLRATLEELGVTGLVSGIKAMIKALQAGETLPPPDVEAWKNLLTAIQQEGKVLEILANEMKRIASFELAEKQQAVALAVTTLIDAHDKKHDFLAEGKELQKFCDTSFIPILRGMIAVLQTYTDLKKPRRDLVRLHTATMESLAMVIQDMDGILDKESMTSLTTALRHLRAQQDGLEHLTGASSLVSEAIQTTFLQALAATAEAVDDIKNSIAKNDQDAFDTALARIRTAMPPEIIDGLKDIEKPIDQEFRDLTAYHDQIRKDGDIIEKINKVWLSIQQKRR